MADSTVILDLSGLRRFQDVLADDLRRNGKGPIRDALKQWAHRYRAFAQERFDRASKGDGTWPPLAASTVRRRRGFKQSKAANMRADQAVDRAIAAKYRVWKAEGRQTEGKFRGLAAGASTRASVAKRKALGLALVVSILRNTGTLFAALNPVFTRKPGALEESIPFGVRVGYGGPAKHPKGKASIADIAGFHNAGAGHLPRRQIIVPPDQRTIDGMVADMERGMKRLVEQSVIRT
jgi:hypothetical protein